MLITGLFPSFLQISHMNFLSTNYLLIVRNCDCVISTNRSLFACRILIILHLLSRLVGLKGDCQTDMATILFEVLLILYINLRDSNRCLTICVQKF